MTDYDLSLIATVHDETLVCGPSMASADIAVAAARAAGYSVQTVIGLDRATEETTAYFNQPAFDHWERWTMDEGEIGRVRTALASRASGRHIAFLDADDLFSENWLSEGMKRMSEAERTGERIIAHPEVNIIFDAAKYLWHNVDQDSPMFSPHFLYVRNCYDALCIVPREAHEAVPIAPRDLRNGISYQDWQFAVETMARGWRHVVIPDTIIFKRRRDTSLVVESRNRQSLLRSLPEMAIDQIRDLTRPT